MLGNNEIGSIHDIKKIGQLTAETKTILHCDATQALGKVEIDIKALRVDALSLSAHKVYGPKGVGALYLNKKLKPSVLPLISGGGQEGGLRAGTLNVPGIVGFGKACSLAKKHLARDSEKMKELTKIFLDKLSRFEGEFFLNGPRENRLPGNLNFGFAGVPSADLIGKICSKVAVSTSSACSSGDKKGSHVLSALGLEKSKVLSSIRVGLGRFSEKEEVEYASEVILKAAREITASRIK